MLHTGKMRLQSIHYILSCQMICKIYRREHDHLMSALEDEASFYWPEFSSFLLIMNLHSHLHIKLRWLTLVGHPPFSRFNLTNGLIQVWRRTQRHVTMTLAWKHSSFIFLAATYDFLSPPTSSQLSELFQKHLFSICWEREMWMLYYALYNLIHYIYCLALSCAFKKKSQLSRDKETQMDEG